jgi:hypothetical protein
MVGTVTRATNSRSDLRRWTKAFSVVLSIIAYIAAGAPNVNFRVDLPMR